MWVGLCGVGHGDAAQGGVQGKEAAAAVPLPGTSRSLERAGPVGRGRVGQIRMGLGSAGWCKVERGESLQRPSHRCSNHSLPTLGPPLTHTACALAAAWTPATRAATPRLFARLAPRHSLTHHTFICRLRWPAEVLRPVLRGSGPAQGLIRALGGVGCQ